MSTLERAIEIAREAHRGQVDKAGEEYIGHPLRVMEAGRTVEDSKEWSFERLEQEGFAPEIIEALRCVTKVLEEEPYDRFIARVKGCALRNWVRTDLLYSDVGCGKPCY